jgi:hypothetical protein
MRAASVRSCSTAAGRWRSAPTSSGLRPWALNQRASFDLQRLAAEDPRQLGVDDLDDLLAGIEHLRARRPHRLGLEAGDDVARHGDVDVGIEQGGTDLAGHLVDVGLGEAALAAEALDDAVEAGGQVLEHAPTSMAGGREDQTSRQPPVV